ncbi:peroxidase 12-like [Aegilops tauschii subsp. strangulata]|uniref:Peroxidase 12 n=1 Tax=Aegilops tauschii TaxID=37682 RepID=M8CQM2_AEGTA
MPPNLSQDIRRNVFLMEDIRAKSGGQPYTCHSIGRQLRARAAEVRRGAPTPTFIIDQLIAAFGSSSLDEKDLVVLSGAHTIGKARCATFSNRFPNSDSDDFVRKLQDNCTANAHRCQDLDVNTPDRFNNKYYINVKEGKGVLTSDMKVLLNETTRGGHVKIDMLTFDEDGLYMLRRKAKKTVMFSMNVSPKFAMFVAIKVPTLRSMTMSFMR